MEAEDVNLSIMIDVNRIRHNTRIICKLEDAVNIFLAIFLPDFSLAVNWCDLWCDLSDLNDQKEKKNEKVDANQPSGTE